MQVRQQHIQKINKESPYKAIKIQDKNDTGNNVEEQASQMHKLSNYYKKKFGQQSDKLMQTPIGSVMSNSNLGKKDPSGTTATDVKTGNGLSGGVSITSSINTRLFMNSL